MLSFPIRENLGQGRGERNARLGRSAGAPCGEVGAAEADASTATRPPPVRETETTTTTAGACPPSKAESVD